MSTDTWRIDIQGMTCAGCEAAVTVDTANPPRQMALAAAVGKAGYSLASVTAGQSVTTETEGTLAGHWVTELEEQNGELIEVIMDLGVVSSRWVGEFDLPKYEVMNYPVDVKTTGDSIELFLTAIGLSFRGTIGVDGAPTGVGQSQGGESESITFRRAGPAEFSEGFLELEAAADDPSLVEILSDDGSELRKRFNADHEKIRLLMLLSPT